MLTRLRRGTATTSAVVAAALVLTACGGGSSTSPAASPSDGTASPAAAQTGSAATFNLTPDQNRIRTEKVDAIAALVPQEIRDRGTIRITGSAGTAPPLRFYADDDTTLIGSEVDLAELFSDVLDLQVEEGTADWAQNFVRIDSGEADAFISNVTVTEERKEKYDFATYR